MDKNNTKNMPKVKDIIMIAMIIILGLVTILLEVVPIKGFKDGFYNVIITKILQQSCGIGAAVLLMLKSKIKLFSKPTHLLYLIPCLIIAVDNFPFWSYFSGNMHLIRKDALDFILFGAYCLSVGIFEECIFRGIIFSVLASRLSRDKKGFILTYVVSSFIFGAAHLFNGFNAGVLLQICYTTLTGGLFAFALIKTKNIFCSGIIHAIYNFCGLVLAETGNGMIGLGSGIVFDVGTTVTMAIISVVVGVFVLYKVFKCPNEEIKELYAKLGVKFKEKEE